MNTREIATEYRLTQWAQAMQDRVAKGESIQTFCENKGISKNTYFYWQRKLRETACDQLALKQAEADLPARSFAEIRVAEPALIPGGAQYGLIHMEIGESRLTIDSAYPPDKLAALLRALGRTC